MNDNNKTVTDQMLDEFAAAFNAHDIEKVMGYMTDDCVFESPAGNEFCGASIVGQDAVAKAFRTVIDTFPDAHWGDGEHFVFGDRGLSQWTFTGTLADGKRVEVRGCDIFTFRGDKIHVKNSYRKQRPPIGS